MTRSNQHSSDVYASTRAKHLDECSDRGRLAGVALGILTRKYQEQGIQGGDDATETSRTPQTKVYQHPLG